MNNNLINLILYTDSYKHSHFAQYPNGTSHIYSYIESRGGAYRETLFFGLQRFLKRYLAKRVTYEDVNEATEFCRNHGIPFNRAGWLHIVEYHGGRLPVHIRAVKEGVLVPTKNILLDIVNTDPKCFWLTSFLETALLAGVWYPTTVATRDFVIKQTIKRYLDETADSAAGIDFMHNDFGVRGASSFETAQIGGMAHLVNFKGTDNVPSVVEAREVYGCPMAGYSVVAGEHSTATSWGRENEYRFFDALMERFGFNDDGVAYIISAISDSYDIWKATDWWIGQQDKVAEMYERNGSRIVIRPDSGDPVETPVRVLIRLAKGLKGVRKNSKGYKVLPDYFRVIQGDGVNEKSIEAILASLKKNKISAENIVFGMGGEMLQAMTRDTLRFAMKCAAVKKFGEWHDVYKQPVDEPTKVSKRGRMSLVLREKFDSFETVTVRQEQMLPTDVDMLEDVFIDGAIVREQTLDEIREIASSHLV